MGVLGHIRTPAGGRDVTTQTDWLNVIDQPPPEGVVVETKIDDQRGVRNEQPLKRSGSLWFFPDASMYVYYTPTHWRPRQ